MNNAMYFRKRKDRQAFDMNTAVWQTCENNINKNLDFIVSMKLKQQS